MTKDDKDCFNCDHCGMDMDMEPYCVAEPVAREHAYGLSVNLALKEFCGFEERRLFTIRKKR